MRDRTEGIWDEASKIQKAHVLKSVGRKKKLNL